MVVLCLKDCLNVLPSENKVIIIIIIIIIIIVVVLVVVTLESSQWLGKNFIGTTGKINSWAIFPLSPLLKHERKVVRCF